MQSGTSYYAKMCGAVSHNLEARTNLSVPRSSCCKSITSNICSESSTGRTRLSDARYPRHTMARRCRSSSLHRPPMISENVTTMKVMVALIMVFNLQNQAWKPTNGFKDLYKDQFYIAGLPHPGPALTPPSLWVSRPLAR